MMRVRATILGNGCVVLIDEIDKAESDVPNGLLEALGSGRFTPLGQTEAVEVRGEPPLVVITTNEERVLPNAFLRRCLVLELKLPRDDPGLIEHLIGAGGGPFSEVGQGFEGIVPQGGRVTGPRPSNRQGRERDRRCPARRSISTCSGQCSIWSAIHVDSSGRDP